MLFTNDEKYIKECFKLAKKGGKNVLPNPLVGCVIVKNDRIISKGYHKKYGEFHAERNAILNCRENLKGATLYCNLEPCSHFGKTPPCTDLIIEKGIKKVVYSMSDPNLKVDGYNKLKNTGIEVIKGVLENEGIDLNKIFIKNITQKMPYMALKVAVTLDSKTATNSFNSKWITGEKSRIEVMKLRNFYQAIMIGSNTAKIDNPNLTARIKNGINPVRIIMDRKGILLSSLNVFKNDGTRIIVINDTKHIYPKHIEVIPSKNFMKTLFEMGIYSILVESGGKLGSFLLKEGFIDEIYQFIAPKILGGGLDFISGFNPVQISDGMQVKDMKIKTFDDDILLNYKIN